MANSSTIELLKTLSNSWPDALKLKFEQDEILGLAAHPLSAELVAALNSEKCSLPYFLPKLNEIVWFGTARDADDLQSTVQALRCWLLPSYGWEDDRGWIVTTSEDAGGLNAKLSSMSPAGYCRWRSRLTDFGVIAQKLTQIRLLEKEKPELPPCGPPPLIQIRQQFVTALVTGDRASAQTSIRLVESHQLDSADNSLFMWLRFWFTFHEFDRITRHKDIQRLTQLRIPRVIRQCVIRAFYFSFLDQFDWKTQLGHVLAAYKLDVHDVVGSLIPNCEDNGGPEVVKLQACYALHLQDYALAESLVSLVDEASVASKLKELVASNPNVQPVPLDELFLKARHQKDWLSLQRLSDELLQSDAQVYAPFLRDSLRFQPNTALETRLDDVAPVVPRQQQPDDDAEPSKQHIQSWLHWLTAATLKEDADFQSFVSERSAVSLDSMQSQTVLEIASQLEKLYLTTDFATDQISRHLLISGLPELMQDFVDEDKFPRDTLVTIYVNLFRIWGGLKCGSLHPPDSQIMLHLAEGILEFHRDAETDIVEQFFAWWKRSPAKALLPFLLGVVDLLDSLGTQEQCGNFWIEGATYLRSNPKYLTHGERSLWRGIGGNHFDQITVDEYLPVPTEVEEVDSIREADLKKIAIVSMREPQAKAAAELIRERSDAEVVLVTKKAAGGQTDSAITADVVLFVWKATSHAVFRAFDNMERNRLSYVQGSGAGSIVLALERWVAVKS